MGLKVHQALGLRATPKRIETEVVRMHMATKTIPILSTTPSVVRILEIMKPIRAMKTGALSSMDRKNRGMGTFRLILPIQKSLKLPLGQRFPQNHLPRKGQMTRIDRNTRATT